MNKFLLAFIAVFASCICLNAAETTLPTNSNASTWSGGNSGYSTTINGFSISYNKISGVTNCDAPSSSSITIKTNNDLRITAPEGKLITKVVINTSGTPRNMTVSGASVNVDTSAKTISWSSEDGANSFTAKANYTVFVNNAITSIVVTTKALGSVELPTFSLAAGTYNNVQTVAISSKTDGADIFYTTDGSTPSPSSAKYSAPIEVNKSMTIKAFACKADFTDSEVASADYTLLASTPAISLASGTFNNVQTVSLSTETNDAEIYYTTDGSMPSSDSNKYNGPFEVNKSIALRAITIKNGFNNSSVASADYSLVAAAPSFSPNQGTFHGTIEVELTSVTDGADIYYTTDGSEPSVASAKYSSPITLEASSTVKAIAVKDNFNNSSIASAYYDIRALTTISFKHNSSDGGIILPFSGEIFNQVTAGSEYVSSFSNLSKCYWGKNGLYTQSITCNLSDMGKGKITAITVSVAKHKDTDNTEITVNGLPSNIEDTDIEDITFHFDGFETNAIEISANTPFYLSDINIIYEVTALTSVDDFYQSDLWSPIMIATPLVTVFQGSNSGNDCIILSDGDDNLFIFGKTDKVLANGDVIPAGLRGAKRDSKLSFVEGTIGDKIESTDQIEPSFSSIAELPTDPRFQYLTIRSCYVSDGDFGYELNDGGTTSVFASNFFDGIEFPSDDRCYDVTGFLAPTAGTPAPAFGPAKAPAFVEGTFYPIQFVVDPTTSVNNVNAAKAFAVAGIGEINVIGEAASIRVFNASGACISSNNAKVSCPAGIYIVVIDAKAQKVIVK